MDAVLVGGDAMSETTGISWADSTWNVTAGCSRVSPGCAMPCYAERDAWRMAHNPNEKISRRYLDVIEKTPAGSIRWTGRVHVLWDALAKPLSWREPRRVFVNSNSDLFHEQLSNDEIAAVFGVMAACDHLTFQVLTKRADRMREWWSWFCRETADRFAIPTVIGHAATMLDRTGVDPKGAGRLFTRCNEEAGRDNLFRNILLGVSVENRMHGLPRIDYLRAIRGDEMARPIPDPLRWLSIEPLLEDLLKIDLAGIGWVVVGGASGKHAQPMHPRWAESILNQCIDARVPFHFKQWGEWRPRDHRVDGDVPRDPVIRLGEHGLDTRDLANCTRDMGEEIYMQRVGKRRAGRVLYGRTWDEFPGAR